MLRDKQLELQMQFLEKATDDLNTLEVVLFEVKLNHQITLPKINAGLSAVHSIKGGAGIMGFRVLSDLAHCLEDYLIFLKNQNNCLEIDPDLLNLLLSGVDWLRQIVKLYSEGRAVNEQWLITFCYPVFQEIQEHLNQQNCADNVTSVLPEKRFQDFISLLFQTEIEEYLQRLESLMVSSKDSVLREELTLMASELGDLGQMLQIQAFTQLCQSILKQLKSTERVTEIAQLALQAWRRSQQAIITHQIHNVPSEILVNEDSLAKQISRLEIGLSIDSIKESSKLVDLVPLLQEAGSANYSINHQKDTMQFSSKKAELIDNLKEDIYLQKHDFQIQIERLHNLSQNLNNHVKNFEEKSYELRQNYDKFFTQILHTVSLSYSEDNSELKDYNSAYLLSSIGIETIVNLQKITHEIQLSLDDTNLVNRLLNNTAQQLQKSLTQIQLRPLSEIVEPFPTALRNLCIEYGKNVQLKIEGANTLIESGILEILREALIHLVRNAFDHGIEDLVTRRACGKPEQGLIEIKAIHQENRTIITIRDDGRGISLEKIRARAFLIGLEPTLLRQATDQELLSLIFEPGFSTSDTVTMLSGRGMGLDVVHNNLKQLRGDIKVDTRPGIGTTFTLSVPKQ